MKKMVLIPEAQLEELRRLRIQQAAKLPPKPEIVKTTEIQQQMDEVVANPDITSNEKARLYGEYLLKYKNFYDQAVSEKVPIQMPEIKDADSIHPLADDKIIGSVPKSMQYKSNLLLQRMKGISDITWDNNGLVSIRGRELKGSNITDLLNDEARDRRHTFTALGWEDVAEVLKDENVRLANIGNRRWTNIIKDPVVSLPYHHSPTPDEVRTDGATTRKRTHARRAPQVGDGGPPEKQIWTAY